MKCQCERLVFSFDFKLPFIFIQIFSKLSHYACIGMPNNHSDVQQIFHSDL